MSEIAPQATIIYLIWPDNVLIAEIGLQLLPVAEIGDLSFWGERGAFG
jgi:hypothetical protein